jgi:hypothetical protein
MLLTFGPENPGPNSLSNSVSDMHTIDCKSLFSLITIMRITGANVCLFRYDEP